MVHPEIEQLLNEQITNEQYAAQLYLSMSAWFYDRDLDGIGHYFRVQSKEELLHADKFFDYLNHLGGTIKLGAVAQPPHEFKDAQTIFALALEHEKFVSQSIYKILKVANEKNDYPTTTFLQWFVNEQVEEEANASQLVTKINMVIDNPSALYLFDQELAKRAPAGTDTEA